MKNNRNWRIHDPRLGAERRFEFRSGATVSNLPYNVWVLEGPNRDWRLHAGIIDRALTAASGHAYITYLPWSPNIHAKKAAFKQEFAGAEELEGGTLLLALVGSADGVVTTMLTERFAMGHSASGLWSVGSSASIDDIQQGIKRIGDDADSPILATAASLARIKCALCLDDGVDMLFLRLGEGMTEFADEIAGRLNLDPASGANPP